MEQGRGHEIWEWICVTGQIHKRFFTFVNIARSVNCICTLWQNEVNLLRPRKPVSSNVTAETNAAGMQEMSKKCLHYPYDFSKSIKPN